MIYFDNAATTYPKPPRVISACNNMMLKSANPGRSGYKSALNAAEAVFNCRQKVSDFFSLRDVENCILTPSCTISLNTVIYGVLKKGDHVVISSYEHNSVLRPVKKLADKGIITYSIAEVFPEDDDSTVDSFRRCMNDKTRLVICTHASNVFGIKLPVKRIGALCKYYEVLFCVDAAQSAGVADISIEDMGADFLCAPGHKGLYGPMGTGILLINSQTIPESLYQGGTGSYTENLGEPSILPDKFESGTVNLPGIAGLSAGVDFVSAKTINRIRNHEMKLILKLYNSLKSIKDIELYTSAPEEKRFTPLLSFNIKNRTSDEVSQILDSRFGICVRSGIHCSPLAHNSMKTEGKGTVRVCPSVFTSPKDIDYLVNAVYLISRSKKY